MAVLFEGKKQENQITHFRQKQVMFVFVI